MKKFNSTDLVEQNIAREISYSDVWNGQHFLNDEIYKSTDADVDSFKAFNHIEQPIENKKFETKSPRDTEKKLDNVEYEKSQKQFQKALKEFKKQPQDKQRQILANILTLLFGSGEKNNHFRLKIN